MRLFSYLGALLLVSAPLVAQAGPKVAPCDTASVLAKATPTFGVGLATIRNTCGTYASWLDAWAASQDSTTRRVVKLIAHGVAAPAVVVPVDTPSTPVVAPPPPASGDGEPTPSGTIVLDTRAGGAQDIQRASSISDVRAYWAKTGGALNDIGFTTNYNGAGKHAFRIDWRANPSGESSYNDNQFYFPSQSSIYASVVIHLGRTATGGGLGDIGSFTPVTDRGGMKRMMWLRQRDNGTDRVYWVWPTEGQRSQQNALSIDNTNFNSYFNADYGVGQDVRWTFALIPPSIVRVWRNGVLVLNNTKATIGPKGFAQLQFITTRFAAQQAETEYWTDLVVWRP